MKTADTITVASTYQYHPPYSSVDKDANDITVWHFSMGLQRSRYA